MLGGSISRPDVERVMGIEPTPSAWKAEVLPLNYTRTESGDPNGIRTRVTALKGRCPRPLDDGAALWWAVLGSNQ
jgi:hypothetical protein